MGAMREKERGKVEIISERAPVKSGEMILLKSPCGTPVVFYIFHVTFI